MNIPQLITSIKFTMLIAISSALIGFLGNQSAQAQVANPTARAQVSFTFDDGLESTLTQAAPTLASYGYTGTSYITGNCIETVGICAADPNELYMTWAQVTQLQNQYGWEIGGHSLTHPLMTEITPTQLENEASQSKAILENHGFSPVSFATPYGDYNDKVLAAIAKYYTSHRGFADTGYNTWPNDNYILRVQQVQVGVSVDTVKGYIDQAKLNNQWLILVFHNVQAIPDTDPEEYEYSTADLNTIAAYVHAQSIPVTTVAGGLVSSTSNLISGSNFESGLGNFTSSSNVRVTVDNGSHGNTAGSVNSVKVVADATQNTSLFSPQVAINPTDVYIIKSYLNVVDTFATGEVALYVDEYDSLGNWISGQYKDAVRQSYDKELSTVYVATSNSVAKASLQVIVTAGSNITAYVDDVRWFSTTTSGPPAPEPTTTNLLANSEFDSGISSGWSTNSPATIQADSANHGATTGPVNSVKYTATTGNTYLFAPIVSVVSTESYTIKSYVNVTALNSGEVAYYIDEYNSSNAWVSGQYKTARRATGSANLMFTYSPSSANVTKASLQVIIVGGSGIQGYVDAIQWLAPTSTPIPPVVVAPIASVFPAISGVAQSGSTLTTSTGIWLNSPTSFTYQWQRCIGTICSNLVATGTTYNVTATDVGATLKAVVTATNSAGSATASSAETTIVTSIPPVVVPPTSLLPNYQFDSGISLGWSTDRPSNISADASSKGASTGVVNSIKLTSSTLGNSHLFSPRLAVTTATVYSIDCYLNITAVATGDVAFYIDEYDINGNWISGQYISSAERSTVGAGRVAFSYTPSSVNVRQASLQVIVVANSGITAYLDDILWN